MSQQPPSENAETVASYELIAESYADATAPGTSSTGSEGLRHLVDALPAGASVLEVGSGPGWDADFLEQEGLQVRRTDITQAFIDVQAKRGKTVEQLDLQSDPLGGPYDGVVAQAVLLHIERAHTGPVFERISAAVHPGGAVFISTREGSGDIWDIGSSGNRYHVVRWTLTELTAMLAEVGLVVDWSHEARGDEPWVYLLAHRA